MTRPSPDRHAGFTLIEVLVAVFVIAIGIGALLTTLISASDSVTRLRDRSFAGWVALNRISETRLGQSAPATGVTTGEVEFAGSTWLWRQEVVDQDVAGFLRINVAVARATEKNKAITDPEKEFPAQARAYGFFGTATGTPNGIDPSWAPLEPTAPGGPGGPGGPDGSGEAGTPGGQRAP
jgi:general secretion pathway protein I